MESTEGLVETGTKYGGRSCFRAVRRPKDPVPVHLTLQTAQRAKKKYKQADLVRLVTTHHLAKKTVYYERLKAEREAKRGKTVGTLEIEI